MELYVSISMDLKIWRVKKSNLLVILFLEYKKIILESWDIWGKINLHVLHHVHLTAVFEDLSETPRIYFNH